MARFPGVPVDDEPVSFPSVRSATASTAPVAKAPRFGGVPVEPVVGPGSLANVTSSVESTEDIAPRRPGQWASDLGTRLQQVTNSVAGGLLRTPVDFANEGVNLIKPNAGSPLGIPNPLSMALNAMGSSNDLAGRVSQAIESSTREVDESNFEPIPGTGFNIIPKELTETIGRFAPKPMAPMIGQPAAVAGINESLAIENKELEASLSPKQRELSTQLQNLGLVDSVKFLATHPGFTSLEMIAQFPQIAQLILARGAGTAGVVGMSGISAGSQNAEQTYREVLDRGGSEEEAAAAAQQVFGPSAGLNMGANMIPGAAIPERLLAGKMAGPSASRVKDFLLPSLGGIVEGAVTEGGDQVLQNVTTGADIKEGVGPAAALGSVIEATLGAGVGGVSALRARPGVEPTNPDALSPEIIEAGNAALAEAAVDSGTPDAVQEKGPRFAGEPVNNNGESREQAEAEEGASEEAAQVREALGAAGRAAQEEAQQAQVDLAPRVPARGVIEGDTREQAVADYRAAQTDDERSRAAGRIAAFDVPADTAGSDSNAEAEGGPSGRQDGAAVGPGLQDGVAQDDARRWARPTPDEGAAPAAAPGAPAQALPDAGNNDGRPGASEPVKAAVAQVLGEANQKVNIHATPADIAPDVAKRVGITSAANEDVEGFYDPETGEVHIVESKLDTSRMSPPERAAWVAAHERTGHAGLRGLAASRSDGTRSGAYQQLASTLERANQNSTVSAVADRIAQEHGYGRERAVEEAVVELQAAVRTGNYAEIESRYGVKVPAAQRANLAGYIARLVAAIRAALGGGKAFTDADVYKLLDDAWRYAKSGRDTRAGRTGEDVVALRSRNPDSDALIENNASGESSASVEAMNRQRDEKAAGQARLLIDRDGSVRQLVGVDAVDTNARAGQVIVQRNIGQNEWTILSQGNDVSQSLAEGKINAARGKFDEAMADDGVVASRAGTFYSQALRAVEEGKGAPKRADADAWKGWLDGAVRRGDMKQSERDWLGLDAWLADRGTTTREELAEFVRANEVQVQDVVLGGDKDRFNKAQNRLEDDGFDLSSDDYFGVSLTRRDTGEDVDYESLTPRQYADFEILQEGMGAEDPLVSGTTKFASYQLPGGENYRELLLTLPLPAKVNSGQNLVVKPASNGRWVLVDTLEDSEIDRFDTEADALQAKSEMLADPMGQSPSAQAGALGADVYSASHFDQPNILAHVRFNERTDADGKRVLFLEEIQSDWHQSGRKRGYLGEPQEAWQRRTGARAVPSKQNGGEILAGEDFVAVDPRGGVMASGATEQDAIRAAWELETAPHNAVPNAPFKNTDEWAMLAFKRMVSHAAENGFDKIAWTTGEQQAARYDLSKQVDEVTFNKTSKGTYDVGAYKGDNTLWSDGNASLQTIADTLGKEVADKIEAAGDSGALSGLDLKFGGAGMRAFYDKILPAAVNKWAKKMGGRVGQLALGDDVRSLVKKNRISGEYYYDGSEEGYSSRDEAEASIPEVAVHSIDLTPAMREAALDGLPLFSRVTPGQKQAQRQQLLGHLNTQGFPSAPVGQQTPGGPILPLKAAADAVRVKLQDKMLPLLRAQERTGAKSGKGNTTITLDDAMNAYRLETLMHGAIKDLQEGSEQKFITPIQGRLKNVGMSVPTFEGYLLARAAEEVNTEVAKIKGAMQDGAAGITTAEARAVLAGTGNNPYTGKPLSALELRQAAAIATLIDGMRDATLQNMVDAGQITPKLQAQLKAKYKFYVPMRGTQADDWINSITGTGKGIGQTKANIKRRLGRGQGNLPQNILGEMAGDMQRSNIAKGKAKVNQSFLRFLLANPMDDLAKVEPVDLEWRYSEATGEAYLGVKSSAEDLDRSIIAMHDGNPVRIRFEDEALRNAVMNMGVDDMKGFVRIVGAINRWRSAVLTRYNPAFTPVNITRDALFGITAVLSEHGAKIAAQTIAGYAPAATAIGRDNVNRPGDSSVPDAQKKWIDWAREASEAGMKTGVSQVDEIKSLQKRMSIGATTLMQIAADGKPFTLAKEAVYRAGKPILEAIENVNDSFENAIRLSTYVALRKSGWSVDKAAEYGKNMTINFNRKGEWGSLLNSVFLFYNASIQGSHAVFRVMRDPKVSAFLGGLAGLQALMAASMMGDDDDDGVTAWDMVPDYAKRTSLIIPLHTMTGKKGDYYALPMPYGFNMFVYTGGRLQQWRVQGARETDPSFIADLVKSMAEAFSPIPFDDGYSSLFGDQVGFAMQLASNTNDWGAPIAQEDAYAQYDEPRALAGKVSTPRAYHATAQLLAKIGGGNLQKRIPPVGYLDVAPEQLEAVVNYMGGGLASLTNKSFRWWEQLDAGNLERSMDVVSATPIASRFVGTGREAQAIAERYYGERGELARKKDVLADRFRKGEDPEKVLAEEADADGTLRGFSLDTYKRDTDDNLEGDLKRTSTGSVQLETDPASAAGAMKTAEKKVKTYNKAIRELRDPEITNEDAANIANSLGLTLEQIGLPEKYNGTVVAPSRVRQRAIRSVQDIRMEAQRKAIRAIRFHRRAPTDAELDGAFADMAAEYQAMYDEDDDQ